MAIEHITKDRTRRSSAEMNGDERRRAENGQCYGFIRLDKPSSDAQRNSVFPDPRRFIAIREMTI